MSNEVGRHEFFARLASSQGKSICVLLVLPERATDHDGAFSRLAETARSVPGVVWWTRMGLTEVALLSETSNEALSLLLGASSEAHPELLCGIGDPLNAPNERFASLELGLHEAARSHPEARLFVLAGDTVVPLVTSQA